MTGQVKEDVLSRLGALGVRLSKGTLRVQPLLLERADLLAAATDWTYLAADGTKRTRRLAPGSAAFTVCQVPFIVHAVSGTPRIDVELASGTALSLVGDTLTEELSAEVLARSGHVAAVDIWTPIGLEALQS